MRTDLNDGSGMIDQGDIDALLSQMGDSAESTMAGGMDAAASGTGTVQRPGTGQITADIEEPLEAFQQRTISDAIGPTMVGSMGLARTGSYPSGVGGPAPAGVLTGEELRGGRLLLMAVVCLLAMCGASLVMVISAINNLTDELAQGRACHRATAR